MVSSTHSAVHQLGTILQRLRQMCGLNLFIPRQVCNGERYLACAGAPGTVVNLPCSPKYNACHVITREHCYLVSGAKRTES